MKQARKKKSPRHDDGEISKDFHALADLTSSEVISQVKAGLSRIAPLDSLEDNPESPAY